MAKLTIAGIPVHPLINDLPAALIPATAVFDVIGMVSKDRSWHRTAYHTLILSLISGVAAGAAGAVDYTGVSRRPAEKSTASIHALMNTGLLAAGFFNLFLRRDHPERPSMFSKLITFASVPLLLYSGMEGAILAYRYHMAETPHEEVGLPATTKPSTPVEPTQMRPAA